MPDAPPARITFCDSVEEALKGIKNGDLINVGYVYIASDNRRI